MKNNFPSKFPNKKPNDRPLSLAMERMYELWSAHDNGGDEFYSNLNESYHKGEFNPREKALVLSWKDFEQGYQITNDNLNLGIHEFMHAMQLEAKRSRDIDATRFTKQFQNILKRLTHQEVKDKLDETRFFREYAFTNQYEFMAVLAEYFFESPKDLKEHFPEIYTATQKMLNFRFAGY